MKKVTCEELIDVRLQERVDDIREVMGRANEGDEDAYEEMHHMVIGAQVRKVVTFTLSWGGPADYFDFYFDEEDDLISVRYRYEDWYDGAERRVTGSELSIIEDAFAETARTFFL